MRNDNTDESNELIRVLRGNGWTVEPYSGRSMYGERCIAITDGLAELCQWNVAVSLLNTDLAEYSDMPAPHQDQLGRRIVLYWPEFTWPEQDETL